MSQDKQHKDNTGVMFKNADDWIAAKDNRPNSGGEATIVCPHCQKPTRWSVSGWNKAGRESGKKFLALAFSLFKKDKTTKPAPED